MQESNQILKQAKEFHKLVLSHFIEKYSLFIKE